MLTLTAILGIGLLIFVHELGHYLACRITGTRTETFSVGFGPRLFGWESAPGRPRRFTWGPRVLAPEEGAMDFRIAAVPLGGYVKMAGENPGEKSGRPDEFGSKPTWARVLIISAGVIMNVIAAVVLYVVAFAGGMKAPAAIAGDVTPGGAAWAAGIEPGDRVVSVDGSPVRTFLDLQMETALLSKDESTHLHYERDGVERETTFVPRYLTERGVLQLGLAGPYDLTLRVDGASLRIAPADDVVVAGVRARGGARTLEALDAALSAGLGVVPVARGEQSIELKVEGRAADAERSAKAPWKIAIEAFGSPKVVAVRGAAERVLEPDDRIVSATRLDGLELAVDSASAWRSLRAAPGLSALTVLRGERRRTVPVEAPTTRDVAAFLADVHAVVEPSAQVKPLDPSRRHLILGDGRIARYERFPAAEAGVRPGDTVLSIGGRTVTSFADVLSAVEGLDSDADLPVVVKGEDGAERRLVVKPARLSVLGGIEMPGESVEVEIAPDGVGQAIAMGVKRTGREILNVFRTIGAFFAGSLSFEKNIGGPVALVKMSGMAAESSWLTFLAFLAYISVSLAVLNILPIPVLDGGHLLFILLEKIKGSPLKDTTIAKFQVIGLVLILLLLGFALRNDFRNMF